MNTDEEISRIVMMKKKGYKRMRITILKNNQKNSKYLFLLIRDRHLNDETNPLLLVIHYFIRSVGSNFSIKLD